MNSLAQHPLTPECLDPAVVAGARRGARYGFWFPFTVSLAVLVGWVFQIPALRSPHSQCPPMSANSAACFAVLSIAGILLSRKPSHLARNLALAGAAFVAGFNFLIFLDRAVPFHLRMDEWIAPNASPLVRLSGLSMVCFGATALGAIGQEFSSLRFFRLRQAPLYLSLFFSTLLLTSYLLVGQPLQAAFPLGTMSFYSAVLFVWTNLCFIALHADRGYARNFSFHLLGSRALRLLFPAVALGQTALIWLMYNSISIQVVNRHLGTSLLSTFLMALSLFTLHRAAAWMNQIELAKMKASAEKSKTEEERNRALHREESARRTSEFKSEFLSSMSHEIRTPLNGILGMTDALAATSLTSEQRECLETVRVSGEALLGIVNDVIDLNKIESGQFVPTKTTFSLATLLQDLTTEFQWQACDKGLALAVAPAPAEEWLVGDSASLRQVLTNLVANAIKFTSEGFVEIDVKVLGRQAGGLSLEFSVRDTGSGIPAESLPKLFTPFFQTASARGRQGSGLGLSIAKRLVEGMGGEIGVENLKPAGARFWARLAFELPAVMPVKAAPVARVKPTGAVARARVLVAEDLEINQKVIAHYLSRLGCEAEIVENGQLAVEAARDRVFDLILLDCQMPVMDGFAAAEAIRQLSPPAGQVPILALTAQAIRGDRERCLAAGMNDYITKPVHLDRLEELLETWLVRAPSRRLNAKQIEELRAFEDGDQLALAMFDQFRARVPERLRAIEASLERADFAGLQRDVHALKSSSAYLGAVGLAALCDQMESLAASQDLAALAPLKAVLTEECRLTLNELEITLHGVPS